MSENRRERNEEFGISIKNEGIGLTQYDSRNDESRNEDEIQRVKSNITRNMSRSSTYNSLPPPERRKSYQVRAMLRKTLSYQRRQIRTNLCCVVACPTMMIVIAFLLSLLFEYYIDKMMKPEKYEYCTREFNGTYVLSGSPDTFKSGDPEMKIGHFDFNRSPCSIWYGSNDHFASIPYDIVPENNEANINRDTIFHPPVTPIGNYPYLLQLLSGAGKDDVKSPEVLNNDNVNANLPEKINTKTNDNDNSNPVTPDENQGVPEDLNHINDDNNGPKDGDVNNDNNNPEDGDVNDDNNNPEDVDVDDGNDDDNNPEDVNGLRKRQNEKEDSNSNSSMDMKKKIFSDPAIAYIAQNIIRPWGFVAINKNNATEKAMIGERNEGPANLTLADLNLDQHTLSNKGYLDYSYTRYSLNMYDLMYSGSPSISFERLPYFKLLEVADEKEIDELLVSKLRILNKILSNYTFDKYTDEEKEYINYNTLKDPDDALRKSVEYMPYGLVYFEDFNEQDLKYKMLISVGENKRLENLYTCEACEVTPYMKYPGRGKRLLYFLTEMSGSILRKLTDNASTITQGFRAFPTVVNLKKIDIEIADIIGFFLYPWGVSFLLPVFVIGLVKEKEERYLVMMNMNGMKSSTYYLFTYLTNLVLCLISFTCFVVVGMLFKMKMFTETSIVILILELFIWANVQVVLSFIISFFFKRNGSALIASFLLVLMGIILTLTVIENMATTNIFFIWPPSAFYYIIYKLTDDATSDLLQPYQLKNFVPGDKIFTATMYMIMDLAVLVVLAFYFKAVIPQEYGSHKPWHLNFYRCFKSKKSNEDDVSVEDGYKLKSRSGSVSRKNPFYTKQEAEDAKALEDDDVRAERERVLSGRYDHQSPLVIKNLRKEYPSRTKNGQPHVAVHSATFAVEEGVVFGLLGPNGAGKTTLIHSLIGVYTPTDGYARLAGYNIRTDMDQVYKRIGICPQHDILWNDLTVKEHLLFYARLKGIPKQQEQEAVKESLSNVGLEKFENNLVKGLSGGEKRRLSIAIALVGNPKLIFLDEPTTGLDPDVRRLIWSILDEVSTNRTIILTTHSMEEAEVLCHRIAIMSHGTLRCCNTQLRLKELYGTGFKLSYSNNPKYYSELKQFITSIIPKEHKVVRNLTSSSIYEFIPPQGLISQLFEIIEQNKEKYGIIDWGISQSSLEEVFLNIISNDDADAN